MKKLLLTISALVLSSTMAYAEMEMSPTATAKSKEAIKEEIRSNLEQVKASCSADMAAAGCQGEFREKIKCVREYKKKNNDFKLSEACKSAMKNGHELRKERKMARKQHAKNKKSEGGEKTEETK
jgi:hypothetical protein